MKQCVQGSFLVASPGLMDPNFKRTVVFVAEHTEEGSFGLILNRPGQVKVAQVWESLSGSGGDFGGPTFSGGPVQPDRLFVLHRRRELSNGNDEVVPGLYLGGDRDLFSFCSGS